MQLRHACISVLELSLHRAETATVKTRREGAPRSLQALAIRVRHYCGVALLRMPWQAVPPGTRVCGTENWGVCVLLVVLGLIGFTVQVQATKWSETDVAQASTIDALVCAVVTIAAFTWESSSARAFTSGRLDTLVSPGLVQSIHCACVCGVGERRITAMQHFVAWLLRPRDNKEFFCGEQSTWMNLLCVRPLRLRARRRSQMLVCVFDLHFDHGVEQACSAAARGFLLAALVPGIPFAVV